MDTKTLALSLDKVGNLITAGQKGRKISASEVREAKKTLGTAAAELFSKKAAEVKATSDLTNKRAAINKSAAENLITRADAQKEIKNVVIASAKKSATLRAIEASITSIKKLSTELTRLAAESEAGPELQALDKGHTNDADIPAPKSAEGTISASLKARIAQRIALRKKATEAVQEQIMGEGNIKPENKADEQGLKPQDSEPISQGNNYTLIGAVPAESTKKGDATGDALAEPTVTANKKAASLYTQAAKLVETASKESNKEKKASLLRRASVFEKMADKVAASKTVINKKASVAASIPVFAATEKVLLVDGSVATVKSSKGDRLIVSIAGVDKEVIASTVKKISFASAPQRVVVVGNSMVDRIQAAINAVTASKKKKADVEDAPIATVDGEVKPSSDASTVQKSETSAVSFNQDLNKWVVVTSESEVKAFDTEEEAKSAVTASKKRADKEEIIDSANPKEPASQEEIVDTLKGLDQVSKDGGPTTKDEQVNEQQGPVAHNASKKTATTRNIDAPTDASTLKVPEGTESIVSKIKGLTQQNKGYTSTTKEEQMSPKTGPIKEASKILILEANNKKLQSSLAVSEGKLLADRAVKVGTITEEQRGEQSQIFAELHQNAPSEFRAYARLLDNLEVTAAKTNTVANRTVKRVEAALASRKSTLIDGSSTALAGSLENGTFFE